MYEPVGYTALNENVVVLRSVAMLMSSPGAEEEAIKVFFEALPKHSKRWYKFTVEELAAITSDMTQPGIRPLLHVFMGLLRSCGRLDESVPVLTYRNDPSLTIDEVATRISALDVMWPAMETPPRMVEVGELKENLIYAIHHIKQLVLQRPSIVWRLREYSSHIHWLVKQGRELTQLEKTFVMHARSTKYGVSKFIEGEDEIPEEAMRPAEMRALDPMSVLSKLQEVTQPGPKMDYMVQFSNSNLEDLVIYRGLWAPSMIVATGFRIPLGLFETLNLQVKDNIPWTAEESIRGTLETGVLSADYRETATNGSALKQLYPTLRLTLDDAVMHSRDVAITQIYDMPDIKLVWRNDDLRYQFFSGWRKRTLEASQPTDWFISQALQSGQIGGAKHNDLTLDRWNLVDTTLLRGHPQYGSQVFSPFDTEMEAWYVRRHIDENNETHYLSTKKLDMRPFMMHYGNTMVRPALSEFYRPNRDLLFQKDDDALRHLRSRIGLTDTEFAQSRIPLTMSFNVWRLMSMYRKLPGVTTVDAAALNNLKDLAAAVAKGSMV
jgi:hypothetical protein